MQSSILSKMMEGIPALRRSLTVLIALWLGLLLGRLVWLLADPGGSVSKPIPFAYHTSSPVTVAAATQLDLISLARSNHFGAAASSSPVIPSAPETNLNLQLKGVRAIPDAADSGGRADSSIAIIQAPDQSAMTYRTGDTIIDGVTLDRILPDRVLIMKGSALETLLMDSSAGGLSVLRLPGQEGQPAMQPRPDGVSSSVIAQAGNLFAFIDFAPVQSGGEVTGYLIQNRGDESYLTALGLKTGDILVEIAGIGVANADRQMLLAQLSSADQTNVTVERDGALLTLSLTIPRGE